MAAEIIGDQMFFAAISRTGATVDSGVLRRRSAAPGVLNSPALRPLAGLERVALGIMRRAVFLDLNGTLVLPI